MEWWSPELLVPGGKERFLPPRDILPGRGRGRGWGAHSHEGGQYWFWICWSCPDAGKRNPPTLCPGPPCHEPMKNGIGRPCSYLFLVKRAHISRPQLIDRGQEALPMLLGLGQATPPLAPRPPCLEPSLWGRGLSPLKSTLAFHASEKLSSDSKSVSFCYL